MENAYWQGVVSFHQEWSLVYLNSNDTISYVLENFHRKFANLVAPRTDGITKCLVRCKEDLVLEEMAKTSSKLI